MGDIDKELEKKLKLKAQTKTKAKSFSLPLLIKRIVVLQLFCECIKLEKGFQSERKLQACEL